MITSGGLMSVAAMSGYWAVPAPTILQLLPLTMGPGTSPVISFVQGSGFDSRVRGIVLAERREPGHLCRW